MCLLVVSVPKVLLILPRADAKPFVVSHGRTKTLWHFYVTLLCRSSHRRCSVRKGVRRNFSKFTGKQLYLSIFFNKVAGFIKKETLAQEFCEIY